MVRYRRLRAFLLIAPLFASPLLRAQTPCDNTPAYSPCELVFELSQQDAAAHPDPYLTVRLHAEFRSPRFRTFLMPAFWDGGRRMVIRFTPTEPGEWVYRVTSNLAAFEGRKGTFTAASSEAPGFIRTANVHHWAYTENNRPHLWMGDTCLDFATLDETVFRRLVDTRAEQKFNHLRGLVVSEQAAARAFPGPDQVNPEYFRALDERVRYIEFQGHCGRPHAGSLGGPSGPPASRLEAARAFCALRGGPLRSHERHLDGRRGIRKLPASAFPAEGGRRGAPAGGPL